MPGSGFAGAGTEAAEDLVVPPARWEAWGFRPVAVPYRAGAVGDDDVAVALRHVRADNPRSPICVYGESAGGTWALLAVARSRSVSCVITVAAPTDADTWQDGARSPAARYFADEVWPAYFGRGAQDDAYEPYDVWRRLRPADRLLLLSADDDPLVPPQQARLLAGVTIARRTVVRSLPEGPEAFVHSSVARRPLTRALARMRAFVGATTAPR